VVLSLFANDFGGIVEASEGRGDWEEGKYWLDQIVQYCRDRGILLLTATLPLESQMVSRRFAGNYPGKILNLLETAGTHHVDVTEDFVGAHLRFMIDGDRAGKRPGSCPLFNGVIGDGHFSAIGSELWARAVGRRLVLLLKQLRLDASS
jgi:hypothetical protein